jgi:hypothetical protein
MANILLAWHLVYPIHEDSQKRSWQARNSPLCVLCKEAIIDRLLKKFVQQRRWRTFQ